MRLWAENGSGVQYPQVPALGPGPFCGGGRKLWRRSRWCQKEWKELEYNRKAGPAEQQCAARQIQC